MWGQFPHLGSWWRTSKEKLLVKLIPLPTFREQKGASLSEILGPQYMPVLYPILSLRACEHVTASALYLNTIIFVLREELWGISYLIFWEQFAGTQLSHEICLTMLNTKVWIVYFQDAIQAGWMIHFNSGLNSKSIWSLGSNLYSYRQLNQGFFTSALSTFWAR